MLSRLAKLASVSARLRELHEKKAGAMDLALKAGKAIGRTALNHPAGTALGVGASAAGVNTLKKSYKGFQQVAAPTL